MKAELLEVVIAEFVAVVAVFVHTLTRRADRRASQRLLFAEALSDVYRWMELPYRIRRRAPGEESRHTLSQDITQLQERIRFRASLLHMEDRNVSTRYQALLQHMRQAVAPALKASWQTEPVTDDRAMNLELGAPLWDGNAINEHVEEYLAAIRTRFQWWKLWN